MNRFFAESIVNERVALSKDDINHSVNVLRLRKGDRIIVSDGAGTDYNCCIVSSDKNGVQLEIIETLKNQAEPEVLITLYQGVPKLDKMELIIQKSVELGVSRIVPVLTKRTIVKIKDGKKRERWQKISESAAKQSGRGIIPTVCEPIDFSDAVKDMAKNELSIRPYELERAMSIKNAVNGRQLKSISIFIGPEGGIDETEAEECTNSGVIPVTLGKRILRTETAGFAAIILTLNTLGDM